MKVSGVRLSEVCEFRRGLREGFVLTTQSDGPAVAKLRKRQATVYSAVAIHA